jgi:hypothetical protein
MEIIEGKTKDGLFTNDQGKISATKIFVNASLCASVFFITAILIRDIFISGAELSQYHLILIAIMIFSAIISKQFSRSLLAKMKSFEIGSDGLKFSFDDGSDIDEIEDLPYKMRK